MNEILGHLNLIFKLKIHYGILKKKYLGRVCPLWLKSQPQNSPRCKRIV